MDKLQHLHAQLQALSPDELSATTVQQKLRAARQLKEESGAGAKVAKGKAQATASGAALLADENAAKTALQALIQSSAYRSAH